MGAGVAEAGAEADVPEAETSGDAVIGDDGLVHEEVADVGDPPTEMYCGGNGCFKDKSQATCKFNTDELKPCPDGYTDDDFSGWKCKERKCKLNDAAEDTAGDVTGDTPLGPGR